MAKFTEDFNDLVRSIYAKLPLPLVEKIWGHSDSVEFMFPKDMKRLFNQGNKPENSISLILISRLQLKSLFSGKGELYSISLRLHESAVGVSQKTQIIGVDLKAEISRIHLVSDVTFGNKENLMSFWNDVVQSGEAKNLLDAFLHDLNDVGEINRVGFNELIRLVGSRIPLLSNPLEDLQKPNPKGPDAPSS